MTRALFSERTPSWRGAVSLFLSAVLAWGAVGLPATSQAQLADPTRAPFAVPRSGPVAAPAAVGLNPATAAMLRQAGVPAGALPSEGGAEAPARVAPPPAPAKPRHRLTSVMLGSGAGRSVAIIDGEVYRVGDKVQGTVLTAIDASGVVLGSGKAGTRLSLFARQPEAAPSAPGVDKGTPAPSPASPAAASVAPNPSLQNGASPDKDTP